MDQVIGVSIVIITYNGSKRLIPTLDHIYNLKTDSIDVELIIIDNNSKDDTLEVLNRKLQGSPFKSRIVQEQNQGQAFARWRGVVEAKHEYILFCDDDNWLNSDYLVNGLNIISQDNSIAALGGNGVPQYEDHSKVPHWFEDYKNAVGCGPQGSVSGDTTDDKGCLYTAGTFVSKKWVLQLYNSGFEPALTGRIGNSLIGGEDTELTYFLKLIGGKLYYSDSLVFKHYMPSNRLNSEYFKKLYRSFGFSNEILRPVDEYINNLFPQKKSTFSILRDLFYLWRKRNSSLRTEFAYQQLKGRIKARFQGKQQLQKSKRNLELFK